MNESHKYVIIGAGQAGCVAALTVRKTDPDGSILLIGEEQHPPYERPALSKNVLKGTSTPESVYIQQLEYFADLGITLQLGNRVEQIDPKNRCIQLDDGAYYNFDKLLLATGSRARSLGVPGENLTHIHTLRSLDDCLSLSGSLRNSRHLVVVGAGFIGLEVAASARQRFQCEVSVVEMGTDLLQRGAPEELRSQLRSLHHKNGVNFLFEEAVCRFEGLGSVERVVCKSGQAIDADCVVIGIGVEPEIDLAHDAGLEISNGILVNEYGETSCEDIFSAGEVTCHLNVFNGETARAESWQVAQQQSVIAARTMCGQREGYNEIPWFWTDQYGHNFQIIGSTTPDLEKIVRTYPDNDKSTTFYLKKGDVVGALTTNCGKDVRPVRDAIRRGMKITEQELADPSVKLKRHIL